MVNISLEFGGGLEHLMGGKKQVTVQVPEKIGELQQLVVWIRQHVIRERHELFTHGNDIRPGVLVLVNDVDWELEGRGTYLIQDGDTIAFISTLHGG
mmetsp:Transcript_4664/g.9385  ORF Transcript_4664/g.9385 Transcript_4664/m.9385 type:complete len:97 (+) Transcript_4664:462-752(+)